LNEALAAYQTVLELAEKLGNTQLGLAAQTNIAKSYSNLSRYDEAAAAYDKLLETAKANADRTLEAICNAPMATMPAFSPIIRKR
jgi:tetratricopeptide (TPR) repeat protein